MPLTKSNYSKAKHKEYSTKIKTFAKYNRQNATVAESKLWYRLRHDFRDLKFRRQFSINNKYIVDFVCLEKRVILEIDGGQHNENTQDAARTKYLEKEGFEVVRFWNNDILENIDVCLNVIYKKLHTPHPALSRKGRGVNK
ncbi:endonuclease domain-containing protein [Endomicrobium proavitum]|uniref:DUF559 domain-containing protein n=1 Tax=Endomicrobium proavitum TaxID=1408281 RepID=A0A0G3WIP1_9BACT|nr:DUF559 domain-containing protein [Endomicrobium proavitum]AKL98506.1 hypothetical protein Epro_1127 [Endomicrobium proavitum]